MISATGSGDCCWKGKRLVFFALGHGHVICSNVSRATSARYKLAVLTAPRQIAARMLEIEHELKTAWVGEVRPKWAYYETVAYKVCAHGYHVWRFVFAFPKFSRLAMWLLFVK